MNEFFAKRLFSILSEHKKILKVNLATFLELMHPVIKGPLFSKNKFAFKFYDLENVERLNGVTLIKLSQELCTYPKIAEETTKILEFYTSEMMKAIRNFNFALSLKMFNLIVKNSVLIDEFNKLVNLKDAMKAESEDATSLSIY